MSGLERVLSMLCTCIVLLWLGAYLAYEGYAAEPELDAVEIVEAPVRALPAPPPKAEAAAEESGPGQMASDALEPGPVGEAELANGHALLASSGAFPALEASYDAFPSFRDYARAMLSLGARFVVVNNRRIVAATDIETGRLSEFEGGPEFSPIPRDYSHEPALTLASRAAQARHGHTARVKMLLPRRLDAGLFGGIAKVLSARGEQPDAYTEIQGRYEPAANGGVWFRVQSGMRSDGSSVSLTRVFDLSALVGRGRKA